MANRIEGVTEKLLECAKLEFLEKGYVDASLRQIASKAGSSKGSIYIRYPDKQSLYRDIVKPATEGFCQLIATALNSFEMLPSAVQKEQVFGHSDSGVAQLVDFIYAHYDAFKILLTSGETTTMQEFIHDVVEIDICCTKRFIEKTGSNAIASGRLTDELHHILSSAFYMGLFEVVLHDMSKEDAKKHIEGLSLFYDSGWQFFFDE